MVHSWNENGTTYALKGHITLPVFSPGMGHSWNENGTSYALIGHMTLPVSALEWDTVGMRMAPNIILFYFPISSRLDLGFVISQ